MLDTITIFCLCDAHQTPTSSYSTPATCLRLMWHGLGLMPSLSVPGAAPPS
jgi:hypothetical protein